MFSKDQFYQASSAQHKDLTSRVPKTLPRFLDKKGVSLKNKGTLVLQPSAPVTANPIADIPIEEVCSGESEEELCESENSFRLDNIPSRQYSQSQKPTGQQQQRYIPGLNSVNDPNVVTHGEPKTVIKEVPEALIEGFLEGTRNPISTLMEYSVIQKLVVVFEECSVERPSIVARYACRVKVNGKPFPQGTGKTKKDAKTASAKIAMSMLLGLESADVDSKEDRGKLLLDTFGRKVVVGKDEYDDDSFSVASSTASSKITQLKVLNFAPKVELPSVEEAGVRPLWDPPKHPVSKLTEYCAKRDFKIAWQISDVPTETGFKADVYICNDYITTAYALTKKDAKRMAAEKALEKFSPGEAAAVANYTEKALKPSRPHHTAGFVSSNSPMKQTEERQTPLNTPINDCLGIKTLELDPSPLGELEQLQELCKTHGYTMEMVVTEFPDEEGMYEAHVTINNSVISLEEGETKKDAKRCAAKEALKELRNNLAENEQPIESLPFHDQIAALTMQTFTKLLAPAHENPGLHKNLAAFIVRQGTNDVGQVVAIGTGNAMIPGGTRAQDGRQVYDLHAVVIARRSLIKYFYREIKLYYGGKPNSIFEPKPGTALLTLKKNVSIHLYMSRAPCGDASLDVNKPDGRLSPGDVKIMNEAMHYPAFPSHLSGFTSAKQDQGFDVRLANEQPPKWTSMSCSDKILKWNTVGLQGALFSYYLSPIYMSSLTIGCLYDHGHITRAMCCRVTKDIAQYLPASYRVTHPYLGRVTTPSPHHAETDHAPDSINWSFGDEKIEIISSHTGKSSERSPFRTSASGASRIAKAGFLFRFRDIAKMTEQNSLCQLTTYSDVKLFSKDYQKAKQTLREHLELTGFGFWTRKPPGLEMFTK